MTKNSKSNGAEDDLSALIRDQLRESANRQRLSSLPVFRVATNTNEVFGDFLTRLDRAESRARSSRGNT